MTFKYKVGQVVNYLDTGEKAKVIRVGHRLDGQKWYNYELEFEDGEREIVRATEIELCNQCNNIAAGSSSSEGRNMGLVSNAISKVRSLALSKQERLFRKYGVVNDCGEITQDGRDLLIELLFQNDDNKKLVFDKLTEVDKEDKKSKKSDD